MVSSGCCWRLSAKFTRTTSDTLIYEARHYTSHVFVQFLLLIYISTRRNWQRRGKMMKESERVTHTKPTRKNALTELSQMFKQEEWKTKAKLLIDAKHT